MRRLRWLRGQDVSVLFAIIAVIVIPAMLTLNTVKVPITGSDVKLNPTPLGYTVSLLIYLVPVLALYWWFSRRCPEGDGAIRRNSRVVLGRLLAPPREYRLDYRRSAYRRTLLTLIPLGFLLDIVLGHAFLNFDNREATLTIIPLFPAFDFSNGHIRSPHSGRGVRVLHARLHGDLVRVRLVRRGTGSISTTCPTTRFHRSGTHGLPPFIAQVQIRAPLLISLALGGCGAGRTRVSRLPPEAANGIPLLLHVPRAGVAVSRNSAVQIHAALHQLAGRELHRLLGGVDESDLGSHVGVAVRLVGVSAIPHGRSVCRCVVQAADRGRAAVGVGDLHDRHGLRDVQDSHQHETRLRYGLVDGDVRATKCERVGKRATPPRRRQTQRLNIPKGCSPKKWRGDPEIAREHRSPEITVASTQPQLKPFFVQSPASIRFPTFESCGGSRNAVAPDRREDEPVGRLHVRAEVLSGEASRPYAVQRIVQEIPVDHAGPAGDVRHGGPQEAGMLLDPPLVRVLHGPAADPRQTCAGTACGVTRASSSAEQKYATDPTGEPLSGSCGITCDASSQFDAGSS